MYVIIKKDKAERLSEKLHAIKSVVCEVMECLDEARTKEYEHEDLYGIDNARHEGRSYYPQHEMETRGRDSYFEQEMARGRGRGMGRGRY